MLCEECRRQTARVVGDRYERAEKHRPAGRAIARQLLCQACSRHSDVDVVVDERDFAQVMASQACWCDASLHLGVSLRWCPCHGEIREPKQAKE